MKFVQPSENNFHNRPKQKKILKILYLQLRAELSKKDWGNVVPKLHSGSITIETEQTAVIHVFCMITCTYDMAHFNFITGLLTLRVPLSAPDYVNIGIKIIENQIHERKTEPLD